MTVQALTITVQQDDQAPILRYSETRHHGGHLGRGTPARIHHQTALLEDSDADTRARAPAQEAGQFGRAQPQPMEPRQPQRDRQRQLRAGAQAGMTGNGRDDVDVSRQRFTHGGGKGLRHPESPVGLGTGNAQGIGRLNQQPGDNLVDAQSDAAKAAPQAPAHVEKPHVQTGGRLDQETVLRKNRTRR